MARLRNRHKRGYRLVDLVDTPEVARAKALLAQQEAELEAKLAEQRLPVESPDDSKHKPAPIDKLLVGPARVTGLTAKAARRRKVAMTQHDYEQLSEAQ